MASRRNKPRDIVLVDQFAVDVTTIHVLLQKYAMNLHTGGEQYRALANAHEALVSATELVLGTLPWVQIATVHQSPARSSDAR